MQITITEAISSSIGKIKKWWAEGNRQLRFKEIDVLGWWIRLDVFNGAGMSGNIKIKAAQSYLKEGDTLKYIEEDSEYTRIVYYETKE